MSLDVQVRRAYLQVTPSSLKAATGFLSGALDPDISYANLPPSRLLFPLLLFAFNNSLGLPLPHPRGRVRTCGLTIDSHSQVNRREGFICAQRFCSFYFRAT